MLEVMNEWISDIPPIHQNSRFGNKAFREWYQKLCMNSMDQMKGIVNGMVSDDICLELSGYLEDSFGNATRIDYGTGHETTFLIFIYCLYCEHLVRESDCPALVLRVFQCYLSLCRHLQTVYFLEPAGSHGAWSLDDYQMLVFYFGAAQLIGHKSILPSSINDSHCVSEFSEEYMYLKAIRFINTTKTGPFYEHSPILYDISMSESWQKIFNGMYKMWKAEVLGKFPVIQHLRFGIIFPCTWTPSIQPSTAQYVRCLAPPPVPPTEGDIHSTETPVLKSHLAAGAEPEFIAFKK